MRPANTGSNADHTVFNATARIHIRRAIGTTAIAQLIGVLLGSPACSTTNRGTR